jgi:transaldolase/glucose-6-phosphate isomerase
VKRWARPDVYGNDRVFAHLRLANEPDTAQKQKLDALRTAGHPVVEIN